jgi:hypothetical protein
MVFETVEISTPAEESPTVSWATIAAGAIAAAALTLVLLAFGAGMGFSAVSPWGNSSVSASTFEIGTGVYLIVVAMALDRTYVAQVVAARAGLNQADADKRVSDVINQAKTALDDARKAAAKLSLWLTASLLIGAFCASLAATEGGYVRDNWNPGLTGQ